MKYNGKFKHKSLTYSIPYFMNDLTWCVKKPENLPVYLYIFFVLSPKVWLFATIMNVFGSAFIIYMMAPFDSQNTNRHHMDFWKTLLVIVFPTIFFTPCKFNPTYKPFRIFHGILLIATFFWSQIVFVYIYRFISAPIASAQMDTINELIKNNFQLMGSSDILDWIRFDEKVCHEITFISN